MSKLPARSDLDRRAAARDLDHLRRRRQDDADFTRKHVGSGAVCVDDQDARHIGLRRVWYAAWIRAAYT